MRIILGLKRIHTVYKYLRYLLIPLIPLYLLVFSLKRMFTKQERFRIPVICIGNITTGGTGKTPMVIYVAQLLQESGFKPGIVSRGYGGCESRRGAFVTDGTEIFLNPEEAGDEPYLIAMRLRNVPVVIGRDRVMAIESLTGEFSVDVIVMDDGFQNDSVYKDVSVLLVDATNPFGNNLILPAGDMREPRGFLKRGDLIVMSRSDIVSSDQARLLEDRIRRLCSNKRIFRSRHLKSELYRFNDTASPVPANLIVGRRVLLITGIANPLSFLYLIERYNPQLVDMLSLPDHYTYSDRDIVDFIEESKNYDYVVVTEKDFVKLNRYRVNDKFYVLRISVVIDSEDVFLRELISRIRPPIS